MITESVDALTEFSGFLSSLYETICIPIIVSVAIIIVSIFIKKFFHSLKQFIVGDPNWRKVMPPDYRISTDMCHCSNCAFCSCSSSTAARCNRFDAAISLEYICDDYLIMNPNITHLE